MNPARKDGTQVLLYAAYFPSRQPRVHLLGGYTQDFRTLVESALNRLNIVTTWERDPY